MLMKFYRVLMIWGVVACLTSCASKSLTPERTKIFGPLSDYFTVVEKGYAVSDGKVTVELERTNNGFPSPYEDGMKVGYTGGCIEPGFTIEFLDAKGNILAKESTNIVYNDDDLEQLAGTGVGETASLRFRVAKGAVGFKMSSSFEYHNPVEGNDSYASSSDDDYDASLDDIKKAAKAAKDVLEMEADLIHSLL